jgi:hypothetical protein
MRTKGKLVVLAVVMFLVVPPLTSLAVNWASERSAGARTPGHSLVRRDPVNLSTQQVPFPENAPANTARADERSKVDFRLDERNLLLWAVGLVGLSLLFRRRAGRKTAENLTDATDLHIFREAGRVLPVSQRAIVEERV